MPSCEYKLDPILNPEKCFQFTPPSKINLKDLPTLPDDWLKQLEKQCCQVNDKLTSDCFDKHVGDISPYALKSTLTDEVQLIYHRLQGNLNSLLGPLSEADSMPIIHKLTEDISYCTPGFHNRVNAIVHSLQNPGSLSELLYQVRVSLAENLARTLIVDSTPQEEIHVWNQVTKVAATMGLGIEANFHDDPYRGNLSDIKIRSALQEEFEEKYVAFNLPFLLAEQLCGLLPKTSYTGFKEDGYTIGTAEDVVNTIKVYLHEDHKAIPWTDFFIIHDSHCDRGDCNCDRSDSDFPVIYDLDWELIRKFFFETLTKETYFTRKPSKKDIGNLLDCAYFSALFTNNDLIGVEAQYIIKLPNESKLQLNRIKTDFPVYWNKLSSHQALLISKIEEISTRSGWNLLYIAAYQTQALQRILDFISEHIKQFDQKTLSAMFSSEENGNGNNLLFFAACYHSKAVQPLLEFISRHAKQFDAKKLEKMFLEEKECGKSLIQVAKPLAIQLILDFISKHIELDPQTFSKILSIEKKRGDNLLMRITASQFESLQPILDFISKHIKQSNPQTLAEIFLRRNINDKNLLMIAISRQPKTVPSILKFISQHVQQFDSETLSKMFFEKNGCNQNLLSLARSAGPTTMQLILEFISRHAKQFDTQTLSKRFLEDDYGQDLLMLEAGSRLAVTKPILQHIYKYKDSNEPDLQTLAKTFLKKVSAESVLKKYSMELNIRKIANITHTRKFSKFFNFSHNYSTSDKITAVQELKIALEAKQIDHRLSPEELHPALGQGRLRKLYSRFIKLKLDEQLSRNRL